MRRLINITITEMPNISIAEVEAEGTIIHNVQDALDLLANCGYQGADQIIIREENLTSDFFVLLTKLAGEILQKFSNYKMRLTIVGNFEKYTSNSLRDFIHESNKGQLINFVSSVADAKAKLTSSSN
jgi:hypothetical protein